MKLLSKILDKIKNFFNPSINWIIHSTTMPLKISECQQILQKDVENIIYNRGTYIFIFNHKIPIKNILTHITQIDEQSDIQLFKDQYMQTTAVSFDMIYELKTGSIITLVFLKK